MTGVEPLAGVVITSREIYDAVVRLTGRVDVLIAQHDSLRTDLNEHERRADTRHDDHERRIRVLEGARWPLPALAVLLAAGSLVYNLLLR